ncbi:double-strand break repair helicase AddA [Enterovirga rhinocerotis]|uniref:DNA 3'-5' helicase n=1 Tax=Enterovirga rhinocerotis TaxID=1339210 RepID=A0A4R7BRC5_9HYPH|nr:double-strand break repair helicase AddA [Enterovirga rhinocerotis]TDR87342.1 DNA helicase/exodeoxyribonuclease V subunit A [Enterovirga rhinocerotis]
MSRRDLVVSPDAIERQRRASDPEASAWVSANAGAGKTKVLTDRVIRLMLNGSPPSRILCLTFTKAAAAEMTIRVFETLGDWVTLDAPALTEALERLCGQRPDRATLARARRLFARAVETPGGLKIETIHAFCERLLHLVPLEAGVPPRFAVLDDGQAAELMAEARAAVLVEASSQRDLALAAALEAVAQEVSGDALTRLVGDAVADERIPDGPQERTEALGRIAAALGLRPGEMPDAIRGAIVEGGIPPAEWPVVAASLNATGKKSDADRARDLVFAAEAPSIEAKVAHYWSVFFTDKGEERARIVTQAVDADLRQRLADEQTRLRLVHVRLLAAETLARTRALWHFAAAIRERFKALKRRLGALDFADLIGRTLALLDGGHAPWVLYRLDRGIDHVLIDEAQDTNPEQWRILQRLTEEFTAGAGRPGPAIRTVFAVGDPKQSIYSFQGADPRLFDESRRHWKGRHAGAGMRFEDVGLVLSFRSAPAILHAVDATFRPKAHFRGLSFDESVTGTVHESARPKAPGRIEVWPTLMPEPAADEADAWAEPVDRPDPRSPALIAAQRVAEAVRHWTTEPDPAIGRPWRPGEVLILARKRGPAFFAAIRALKAAGVPVAGADRIDINQQIAVNDLVAAGQAALLPGHDLALACALKSPLVGLGDDDLIRIAADRPEGQSLEAALEAAAAEDPRARAAFEALMAWRRLARSTGAFGFFATLLGPGGGRRRLVERLGGEAQDAIDTFLCRAQAEERALEAPSLTAFLARFESAEHVIKRDPEGQSGEVRVMTVHGAKGLEAPLVVLLDGCDVAGQDPKLIALPTGRGDEALPVWAPGKSSDPPLVGEARAALHERGLEEHHRLLYVALTRARDRLVLVPYTGLRGTEPPEAWCAMVRRGFAEAGEPLDPEETPWGAIEIYRQSGAVREPEEAASTPPPLDLPGWLTRAVEAEPEPLPPLRPSSALAAAGRGPSDPVRARARREARRHGVLVHALIDHLAALPAEAREETTLRFLTARGSALSEAERAAIAADARALLDHPGLAPLFAPGSRGEVSIAGRIGPPGGERAVSGQIDRLAVGPDSIVVADFKTGAPPRGGIAPDRYLAQLAVYRELLRETHPGRALRALLVWPEGPTVLEPAPEALDGALARVLALP